MADVLVVVLTLDLPLSKATQVTQEMQAESTDVNGAPFNGLGQLPQPGSVLGDPVPQRFRVDPELLIDPHARARPRRRISRVQRQPDCALPKLLAGTAVVPPASTVARGLHQTLGT